MRSCAKIRRVQGVMLSVGDRMPAASRIRGSLGANACILLALVTVGAGSRVTAVALMAASGVATAGEHNGDFQFLVQRQLP